MEPSTLSTSCPKSPAVAPSRGYTADRTGGSLKLPESRLIRVESVAEPLQVAFDSGAKRILLPTASVKDIQTIPGELFAKFQISFYGDPTDAVFKALGVQ